MIGRAREFARKRPRATMAIAALVAFLVGLAAGLGGADDSERIAELESENGDLVTAQEDLRDGLDEAEALNADYEAEVDDARAEARQARQRLRSADRRARQNAESELEDERAALDARGQELDEREADIERVEQSTFRDGTWEVGADIAPGTYRAPGGGGCYWERLRSPGGGDIDNIIANEVAVQNPTVTLNAGEWFRPEDCGKWQLVG